MTAVVDREIDLNVTAEATTTAATANATVTLSAAVSDGVSVGIDYPRLTKELHAGDDPKKFKFETEIVCTKPGTWPITWTARISSYKNSDTTNNVLKRITKVTCSVESALRDDYTFKT